MTFQNETQLHPAGCHCYILFERGCDNTHIEHDTYLYKCELETSLKLLKGTSNYLAEFFKKTIEIDYQFFLDFLYAIRGILPEININLPCIFLLECHKHGGT